MPTEDLEKQRAKCRRWHNNHRVERNAYKRLWSGRHPEHERIHKATRTMIVACFRQRHAHFFADKIVGCTPEFFRGYIEGQFKPGMAWENHGEWHIDHIRPLSSFDFEAHPEDVFRAGHYTNLQVLWAREHLIKGAKYPVETVA